MVFNSPADRVPQQFTLSVTEQGAEILQMIPSTRRARHDIAAAVGRIRAALTNPPLRHRVDRGHDLAAIDPRASAQAGLVGRTELIERREHREVLGDWATPRPLVP